MLLGFACYATKLGRKWETWKGLNANITDPAVLPKCNNSFFCIDNFHFILWLWLIARVLKWLISVLLPVFSVVAVLEGGGVHQGPYSAIPEVGLSWLTSVLKSVLYLKAHYQSRYNVWKLENTVQSNADIFQKPAIIYKKENLHSWVMYIWIVNNREAMIRDRIF